MNWSGTTPEIHLECNPGLSRRKQRDKPLTARSEHVKEVATDYLSMNVCGNMISLA